MENRIVERYYRSRFTFGPVLPPSRTLLPFGPDIVRIASFTERHRGSDNRGAFEPYPTRRHVRHIQPANTIHRYTDGKYNRKHPNLIGGYNGFTRASFVRGRFCEGFRRGWYTRRSVLSVEKPIANFRFTRVSENLGDP